MLISGFTFIRNARKFDYPILECIGSMLPLVDELVINVGSSDDDTEELIAGIESSKLKIIYSYWDDSKTRDGLVLSEQTNTALSACKGTWALYLQADEGIHEDEHERIREAVSTAPEDVEAFSFRYLHFYGGYSFIQRRWNWYPSEIRLIRRSSSAQSFGDAQSFCGPGGRSLNTAPLVAHIFHYGHARHPVIMKKKIHYFHRFWHGDHHKKIGDHAYLIRPKDLTYYWGTHPAVFGERVLAAKEWSFKPMLGARIDEVVIVYRPCQTAGDAVCVVGQEKLAEEVREVLSKVVPQVVLCKDRLGFLRLIVQRFLKGFGLRVALIDLVAEKRSPLVCLLLWWTFKTRLAYCPSGKLSYLRRIFYQFIHWGRHEDLAKPGFVVPESVAARCIAAWLGEECRH